MGADLLAQLQRSLGAGYRVERELGGGGMSRVFVATEVALGRQVVVKLLTPDVVQGVSADRFRHEIQLAASLQHPHIVPLLTAGESDGLLYFTMPFIHGESLRALLNRSGELGLADAVAILRDVTRALAHAHRHGIAHRDIKPENIMVSEDGALVLDFGVAKALSASTGVDGTGSRTGAGVSLGTPAYMSPEQATGDPATDHRTDLYSLGVLAYELLAGFTPFAGRPLKAVITGHLTEVPPPVGGQRAGVPPRLEALIARCLAKRPADRPPNAEAILRELDAIAADLSAPRRTERTRAARRRAWAAGAAAVVLVGVLAWLRGPGAAAPAERQVRTLAVLPFVNMGSTREDEAFGDGMTEELIAKLGKVDGLRVKSAFALKGSTAEAEELGQKLDVETVVTGSVRRSGGTTRISARLVNAADGFQLWSDSFEREIRDPSDVFRVQDEIAAAIVDALKLELVASGRAHEARQTTNLEAYRAFLDGRHFMAKRTADGLRRAVESFSRAVALDSSYALAWAGLADAEALSTTYGFLEPREAYARALRAANEALRLDSALAEAHASIAYVGINYTWDWPTVEARFQRAIALDPNYATAHHWYSLYLNAHGRSAEALSEIRRALELDPLSLIINRELGRTHYYAGRLDSALAQYRRVEALDPGFASVHVWIARALIARGDFAGAIRQLQDRQDFQGGHASALLGYAYARNGQTAQAEAILAELLARSRRQYVWPMYLAVVHLGLGDRAAALDALERDLKARSPQLVYARVDPLFAELRGAPRFEALFEGMGFAR